LAGEDRRYCKKCDRSFRHITAVCPFCNRKLVDLSQAPRTSSPAAKPSTQSLPPLPQAVRAAIKTTKASSLETPDYLGATTRYVASDALVAYDPRPFVAAPALKSDHFDSEQTDQRSSPSSAAGWALLLLRLFSKAWLTTSLTCPPASPPPAPARQLTPRPRQRCTTRR
jgi:hypothetical protein